MRPTLAPRSTNGHHYRGGWQRSDIVPCREFEHDGDISDVASPSRSRARTARVDADSEAPTKQLRALRGV